MSGKLTKALHNIQHRRSVLRAAEEIVNTASLKIASHEKTFGYAKNDTYHLPSDIRFTLPNLSALRSTFQMTTHERKQFNKDLYNAIEYHVGGLGVHIETDVYPYPTRVTVTIRHDEFNRRA